MPTSRHDAQLSLCGSDRVARVQGRLAAIYSDTPETLSTNRILVIVDGLPLGGMERQIVALLSRLKKRGHYVVSLAVLDHGGGLDDAAAAAADQVVQVRRHFRYDITPLIPLASFVRRHRVGAIHAFGWMSGLAGLAVGRATGVPVISATIHAAPPVLGWREGVIRWCGMRSDRVVANSPSGLAAFGLTGHPRSQVIFNGIDIERLRSATPTTPVRSTICMVANFNKWKDHQTAVSALPLILAAVPDAELLLVGQDRGTLAATESLIRTLQLEASVTIVRDCSEPERLTSGADVCLLASHEEGFSNAILEYMALGKPIVASDTCGDAARLARDAGAALLYPHQSASALAEHVIALLRDPERARRMGEAGAREAGNFSVERLVDAYEALYREVLHS